MGLIIEKQIIKCNRSKDRFFYIFGYKTVEVALSCAMVNLKGFNFVDQLIC